MSNSYARWRFRLFGIGPVSPELTNAVILRPRRLRAEVAAVFMRGEKVLMNFSRENSRGVNAVLKG